MRIYLNGKTKKLVIKSIDSTIAEYDKFAEDCYKQLKTDKFLSKPERSQIQKSYLDTKNEIDILKTFKNNLAKAECLESEV